MIVWIDEQLSRRLAPWLRSEFGVDAVHVFDLGLSSAPDGEIFAAARAAGAVFLSKDWDFVGLVERYGPPPKLIWLTTGNASNRFLQGVLRERFSAIRAALDSGDAIVEVTR